MKQLLNLIKLQHILYVASIGMMFMAGTFLLMICPPILIIGVMIALLEFASRVLKFTKRKLIG